MDYHLILLPQVMLYTEVLCFLGLDPTTGQPLEELPSIDGAFTEQLFIDSSTGHSAKTLKGAAASSKGGGSGGYGNGRVSESDLERASQGSFTSVEMDD